MISESTKARFAREVAKFPADQKQSAVMACLSIVQQEQGRASPDRAHGPADLEHKLGVHAGETTADGLFTLQPSECQGACADAPVLLVNDRHMCSFMSHEKLDQLVDSLKKAEAA